MMADDAVAPVVVTPPRGERLPLVFDSPHSGVHYPADFGYAVPHQRLRRGEDTHVDRLWGDAPDHGATLLAANFPRTYIDANRALEDFDPAMLDGEWPLPAAPGEKSRLGYGLVWTRIDKATPLYDRKLTPQEVRNRVDRYWRPYHAALDEAIGSSVREFGGVWHLNLHSMPNDAYERLGRTSTQPLADFVLGDRDGTTCEPAFVELVASTLRGFGYTVAVNDPYKGVELIARIGQPAQHRHSMQIEIRRPVYMDEATREPNAGFEPLRRHLSQLTGVLARYTRERLPLRPRG
ncbi:N-formylglutamate amidohydrolase [Ramlibacter sp.]|uniref:N-formylglutamate amidohydrolase n=1 Tax=Ramlibacter sp. TaxID=1917967 RepID=UPI002C8FC607|nr:N-formylglutamate amidohydrolase [Ramlibacter sp.]HWI83870.1 N-formylglutamate amidohydrolase [Ramlibacter sp.]